jgi:hypothetical protein
MKRIKGLTICLIVLVITLIISFAIFITWLFIIPPSGEVDKRYQPELI